MKLLIIEDERKLSDSIVTYLSAERYICEQAFTFDDAMSMLDRYEYDCVLLDLMLPGGDGLDILRAIRSKRNPATIFTRFNHSLSNHRTGVTTCAEIESDADNGLEEVGIGNGLDLSIVKSICDYHSWQITNSYLPGTHTFTVRFAH